MSDKSLEEILEEFKQCDYYAVELKYGEGIGGDDFDIPIEERAVRITGVPVGVSGAARVVYKGTIGSVRVFDFENEPLQQVNNPPEIDEMNDEGLYVWGTDGAMEILKERLKITGKQS